MSDKFVYTYSAPTKTERSEIENIRRHYPPIEVKSKPALSRGEAMKRVKKLHGVAYTLPKAITIIYVIFSVLVFGGGMSLCLQWQNYWAGVPIGIGGIVMLCFVRLVQNALLRRGTARHGEEIVALCELLLNEEK